MISVIIVRRVSGDSMLPTLKPGQLVFGFRSQAAETGNVVVFRHNGLEKIKRVAKVDDDKVYLLGDNPDHSTDSRQFGWISKKEIMAKVIWPSAST